jgi:hypothetical protein
VKRAVIKILGVAGMVVEQEPDAMVGQYLKTFDVDARDGRGEMTSTPHVALAKQFTSKADAYNAWRRRSKVRPMRSESVV